MKFAQEERDSARAPGGRFQPTTLRDINTERNFDTPVTTRKDRAAR